MRIALFDIDGTLLRSGGAGRRAFEASLLEQFGTTGPADYRYDGKTDRQIARDLMRAAGFDDATIDARMGPLEARYLEGLAEELRTRQVHAEPCPGIPALLDALEARTDVVLGLLTGNVLQGARLKLAAVGIDHARFAVAAYGSDHEHRPALPAIAQSRASARLGRAVPGDALVIIGDTPHDIHCGRGVGARAIAVATGSYGVADLAAHGPAHCFADLTDTEAVITAICDA